MDIPKIEAEVESIYAAIREEAGDDHWAIIAQDDQIVTDLRAAGWSDMAIGAYLLCEVLTHDPYLVETLNFGALMVSALYHRGGSVR